MELHSEVPQLYDEVRINDERAACVGGDSGPVFPSLGLIVNGVKINGFVCYPAGPAQYNWLIRVIIIPVSPDPRRVKEGHAHEQVVRVRPTGDKDLLVAGKFRGALTIARQYAAARYRCFIERDERRSGRNSIRIVKTSHVRTEHENFSVHQERGAGCTYIQAAFGRDRTSRGIVFVNRVSCVSFEKEQSRVAELERPMAGTRSRHRCRFERELLIGRSEELHGICVAASEQHTVVGKQRSGVPTARHIQVPKRGGK
ncbi:MAG: hypothetical protein DME64_02435 [Verrucomicrobia bacterium]|nr:MAG: hypothetical protein DME64_02435 [Verrucomicrobiota bacterium]